MIDAEWSAAHIGSMTKDTAAGDRRALLLAAEQRLVEQLTTVRTALYAEHNAALIAAVEAHYPGAWKLWFTRDPDTKNVRLDGVHHGAGIPMGQHLNMSTEEITTADEEIEKALAAFPVGKILEADLGWILYWAHEEDYKWDSGWIVLENLPTDVHTAAHLIR